MRIQRENGCVNHTMMRTVCFVHLKSIFPIKTSCRFTTSQRAQWKHVCRKWFAGAIINFVRFKFHFADNRVRNALLLYEPQNDNGAWVIAHALMNIHMMYGMCVGVLCGSAAPQFDVTTRARRICEGLRARYSRSELARFGKQSIKASAHSQHTHTHTHAICIHICVTCACSGNWQAYLKGVIRRLPKRGTRVNCRR